MSTPIKPEDIREGDLIRREPHHSQSQLKAVEYVAIKNGHTHGLVDDDDNDFFLLDRPTPPVDLPTEPTLGWATWPDGTVEFDTWRFAPSASVTAFTPAVAVPADALDEFRIDFAAWDKAELSDARFSRRAHDFLTHIDEAQA